MYYEFSRGLRSGDLDIFSRVDVPTGYTRYPARDHAHLASLGGGGVQHRPPRGPTSGRAFRRFRGAGAVRSRRPRLLPSAPKGLNVLDDLSGKVAVVTGAASGIGRGLARKAASEGMHVVLGDVEPAALTEAEEEIALMGAEVLAVPTDVSDAAAVEALAEAAFERFGAVHLVCLNAGVFQAGVSWQRTEADWAWVLGVNLWGPDPRDPLVRAPPGRAGRSRARRDHVIDGRDDDGRVLGSVRRVEVRRRRGRGVRRARPPGAGLGRGRLVPRARRGRHADRLVGAEPPGDDRHRGARWSPRRPTTTSCVRHCRT